MGHSVGSTILCKLQFHWPLVLVASLALPLLLIHLGSDYLWEDEGDTAVLAVNILKFGAPRAWDGVTFIDSDAGARLNNQLVMISHPWVQYYVAAASFAVFGQNTWAARLPFALAGWLTVLVTYLCAYDLTKNRWIALCSATLLISSVQFLLFCRQCRYYALSMLLGSLLVWIFFNLKSVRSAILFAIVGILSFHCNPFGIVVVGALGLVSLVYPLFTGQRRFFYWVGPIIALLTLPLIIFARSGYAENSDFVNSPAQFAGRVVQYAMECATVTPLIGIAILASIYALFFRGRGKNVDVSRGEQDLLLHKRKIGLLLVILVTLVCSVAAMAVSESSESIWKIGIRYTPVMMPLIAIAAGLLIIQVGRGRVTVWLPLLLIFSFTNLGQLTPWIFWDPKPTTFDGKESVRLPVPQNNIDRYLNTGQLLAFVRDLIQENPGTLAKACQFLQEHANPGDLVITNYEWEPLYFYTRLPQSLKIFPDYPIYLAAKRKGLPEYVFNVDRVRWVVWRPVWEGYLGYFGDDIRRRLLNGGARITKVAEFPETIFENRPEIHFRRFAGGKYFFMAPNYDVPAQIFRIDWPGVLRMEPSDQPH